MVIHIGMESAAGISPAGSGRAVPLRRGSNWRNRTVARAKSAAEMPETPETSKTPHFWAFETASPPRRKPAETGGNLPGAWPDGENPALYTVRKNYLARRAGSAVARKLKARSGRRSGEEF
jgi:hypothetical protein